MYKDYFPKLITELCDELGIKQTVLSDGRIRILLLNGKERILWSKKFELNSVIAARIADNKTSTYEVLKQHNIPCIEYKKYLCHYQNNNCYLDMDSLCNIYNDLKKVQELVLKPENGYEGTDVYRCTSIEDILSIMSKFQKPYNYICSSPYYQAKAEYRTICLNGTAMLSYKKNLPFIIGNGKDTIQQLLKQKYDTLYNSIIKEISYDILCKVPALDEKVSVGWKFNLSQGAYSTPINNPSTQKVVQELSIAAANSVHINFSSVDVIETIDEKFLVMEINSGVVLNKFIDDDIVNYSIAKRIYKEALLSMFDTNG